MAIEEIEIEGYLGQNPKLPSDKYPDMLTFSVGVTQSYKAKDSDIRESRTTWYDIVCYDKGKTAYLQNKLFKGDKVIVKGKPSIKTWIGKDSATNATISIVLTKIALMKKEGEEREIKITSPAIYGSSHVEDYYDNNKIIPKLSTQFLEDEIPF